MSKNGLNLNMGLVMGLSGGGGKSKYLGPVDHLPILTASDEGVMAYDKGLNVPVYWDGNDWKSVVDGSTVTPHYLRFVSEGTTLLQINTTEKIKYSLDNGRTWSMLVSGSNIAFGDILLSGEIIDPIGQITTSGDAYNASGDITSLINGRGGDVELPNNFFESLFEKDSRIKTTPHFPSTTLDSNCYDRAFSACTNATTFHFATLNDSPDTFMRCSAAVSLTIDAVKPPIISSTTISGLKDDCAILVPASAVADYKAALHWSIRADYIQAQP